MKMQYLLVFICLLYTANGKFVSQDEAEDFDNDEMESQMADADDKTEGGSENDMQDPRPLILWCRRGRRKVCRYHKKCGKRWWSKKVTCRYVRRCACECPAGTHYRCVWLWKRFCWKVLHATFCHGRKHCWCRPRARGDVHDAEE